MSFTKGVTFSFISCGTSTGVDWACFLGDADSLLREGSYSSIGTFARSAWFISFFDNSSTSVPDGAFAMKSTWPCCIKEFIIMSPPLSPSTNNVTIFFLLSSMTVLGMFVPFIPITFEKPCLSIFITSALPSTTIISSESSKSGPAGNFSEPYSTNSFCLTSS